MKEKIFKGITWWFALQCLTNILEQRYFRDLSKKNPSVKLKLIFFIIKEITN